MTHVLGNKNHNLKTNTSDVIIIAIVCKDPNHFFSEIPRHAQVCPKECWRETAWGKYERRWMRNVSHHQKNVATDVDEQIDQASSRQISLDEL